MQDRQITDLYWQRDESAIQETDRKYGRYLYSIACNILLSREDSEESVNDTLSESLEHDTASKA